MNINEVELKNIRLIRLDAKELAANHGEVDTQIKLTLEFSEYPKDKERVRCFATMLINILFKFNSKEDIENIFSLEIQGGLLIPSSIEDDISENQEFANIISSHVYPHARAISQPILDNILQRSFELPLDFKVDIMV